LSFITGEITSVYRADYSTAGRIFQKPKKNQRSGANFFIIWPPSAVNNIYLSGCLICDILFQDKSIKWWCLDGVKDERRRDKLTRNFMKRPKKQIEWEHLSDEELLQMKIRDLGLSIQGSAIEGLINDLYEELDAKGIQFHPPCYLADEWLCPDGEPIIGIPFFLANPRLKRLEQKMMYEVEGGTDAAFMKLLRHETGHALNYAYKFYKKTRWRELFGSFTSKYSDSYYFYPYSKRFVVHIEGNYAQSHPDEDFAETFAVWLNPDIYWERKYKGWSAIKKLRYVDSLIRKSSGKPPVHISREKPPWSASRMTSTLSAYYERKRELLGDEFKGFYDDILKKLFLQKHGATAREKASKILRQHRLELVNNISRWTGHRKYDARQLINKLVYRCEILELYGNKDDITGAAILIATIASNTLRIPKKHKHK